MTKNDLLKIVNLVNANWPIDGNTPKQDVLQLWWNCLGDLEYQAVADVVNALLIEAAPWRPRVGEVRKRVVDGGSPWPSPEAAWNLAEGRRFAADMGIEVPGVDGPPGLPEALTEAMRLSRGQGKQGFTAAWTTVTGKRYAVPSPETTVDGVQLDD